MLSYYHVCHAFISHNTHAPPVERCWGTTRHGQEELDHEDDDDDEDISEDRKNEIYTNIVC